MDSDKTPCPICKCLSTFKMLKRHLKYWRSGQCFTIPCNYPSCTTKSLNLSSSMRNLSTVHYQDVSFSNDLSNVNDVTVPIKEMYFETEKNVNLKPINIQLETEILVNDPKQVIKPKEVVNSKQKVNNQNANNLDLDDIFKVADLLVAILYANKSLVKDSVQPIIDAFSKFYKKNI